MNGRKQTINCYNPFNESLIQKLISLKLPDSTTKVDEVL